MSVTPEDISRQLAALTEQVRAIYSPSPAVALADRVSKPIGTDNRGNPFVAPIAALGGGAQPIWQSSALDTAGFTLQNAFVSLTIRSDTHENTPLTMFGILEGSNGSAYCEIARSMAVPYVGTGYYALSLMSNGDSLATMIRFKLMAVSAANAPNRQLGLRLDGVLCAGFRF